MTMRIIVFCSILLGSAVFTSGATLDFIHQNKNVTSGTPRNEFVTINNKMYFIGVAPELTFKDAMTNCQNLGMSLVSLENLEKHNEIFLFLYTYYSGERNYWTSGMRYLGNNQDWIWINRGNQISWFNWANNQPGNDAQCIYLNVHGVDGWHDGRCEDDANAYVCENPC